MVGPERDLDLLFGDVIDEAYGTLIENLILMSNSLYRPAAGRSTIPASASSWAGKTFRWSTPPACSAAFVTASLTLSAASNCAAATLSPIRGWWGWRVSWRAATGFYCAKLSPMRRRLVYLPPPNPKSDPAK